MTTTEDSSRQANGAGDAGNIDANSEVLVIPVFSDPDGNGWVLQEVTASSTICGPRPAEGR